MQLILTIILFATCFQMSPSSSKSYEQVAFDYFLEEMLYKYENLDVIVFSGRIEERSACSVSYCLERDKNIEPQLDMKISAVDLPSTSSKVKTKIGWCSRLIKAKKKIGKLYLYKSCSNGNNIVVSLMVSMKLQGDIISLTIDKENRTVIDLCQDNYDV